MTILGDLMKSSCIAVEHVRMHMLHGMFQIVIMFELAMLCFIQAENPKKKWVIRGRMGSRFGSVPEDHCDEGIFSGYAKTPLSEAVEKGVGSDLDHRLAWPYSCSPCIP